MLLPTDQRKLSLTPSLPLFYEDLTSCDSVMAHLNELRKQNQFTDVQLCLDTHVIPAHRAVLACRSPYLFDYYKNQGAEGVAMFEHELGGNSWACPSVVEMLVNFAYTGK